ncbi:MAG: hypothetical protein R3C28_14340 [Pirellulaceae bacterium]
MFKLQLFPNKADDLLDGADMPPTDNTELNYRPRPLSNDEERRLTGLLLIIPVPIVVLGVSLHFLIELFPILRHLTIAVGIVLAGWLGIRRLTGALQQPDVVGALAFGCVGAVALAWEFATIFSVNALRVSILVGWVTSALIARQVAAWILVAPTVDHERMERWRSNVPGVLPSGLSRDCPELLTYTVSPVLLMMAWILSWWILLAVGISTCWWPVLFALSVQAMWLIWHIAAIPFVPFPNPDEAMRATWNAIVVFLTYDIH